MSLPWTGSTASFQSNLSLVNRQNWRGFLDMPSLLGWAFYYLDSFEWMLIAFRSMLNNHLLDPRENGCLNYTILTLIYYAYWF